jgi:hypothetical protein
VQHNNSELLEAVFSVRSVPRSSYHYERVLRRQLQEYEVGVRWPSACEDVIPEVEEIPLLEAVTNSVTENTSVCVIVIYKV